MKIYIKYNKFLDPIFIAHIKSHEKWKDWTPPSPEKVREKVILYRTEWKKYEKKISDAVYEILGLSFKRNRIDVHIVSGCLRSFSNPIVIKSSFTPEEFISVLTHELLHVLFGDNRKEYLKIYDYLKIYSDDENVINHIMIDPFLKYLFIDVLDKHTMMEQEIVKSKKHSTDTYTRAWEIVDRVGYKELINKIKKRATQ